MRTNILTGTKTSGPTLRRRVFGIVQSAVTVFLVFSWGSGAVFAQTTTAPKATQPAKPPATAPAGATTKPTTADIVTAEFIKLTGQDDTKARLTSAITILNTNSKEGTTTLVTLLQSKNHMAAKLSVCEAIAQTQGKSQEPAFIGPLLALLNDPNSALQEAAAAALGVYSDPGVVAKLRAYSERRYTQNLQKSLIIHLRLLYERSNDTDQPTLLLSWLKSTLADERFLALDIIHKSMSKGTEPANGILQQIRGMLNDPQDSVRIQLIKILRDLRDEKDAPRVRDMFKQKQAPAVREAVYKALGLLEDPASISQCIQGLNDPVDSVAAEAANALGLLSNPEPAPELLQSAVQTLLEKTKKPIANDVLRENIIGAMAKIASPKFATVLRAHAGAGEKIASIRQSAIRGIGHVGDLTQINLVLERMAQDSDPGVREASAEAVGKLGSSVEHLRSLRSRIDSKVESSAAARNAAWEAYRQIFGRLQVDNQQVIIESWNGTDPATLERRIALLHEVEKQLSASNGDQKKKGWVAQRLIDDYLQTASPEKAIDLAANMKNPANRDAAAASLLGYLQKTVKTNVSSAQDFLNNLKKAVPDLFGPKRAPQFNQVIPPPATKPAATKPAA